MRISDWSSDVCSSDLCSGHLTEAVQIIDDPAIIDTRAARIRRIRIPDQDAGSRIPFLLRISADILVWIVQCGTNKFLTRSQDAAIPAFRRVIQVAQNAVA